MFALVSSPTSTAIRKYGAIILPRMHTSLSLFLAITCFSLALLELTGAMSDALDKTDCNGVVLDDSPFAEPIVRDHRDKSYGALSNPAMRPLGGGEGYGRIVPRPATVVRTADELRAALLVAGRAPKPSTSTTPPRLISRIARRRRGRAIAASRARAPRMVAPTTRSPSPRTRRSRAGVGAAARAARACSRARSPIAHCST